MVQLLPRTQNCNTQVLHTTGSVEEQVKACRTVGWRVDIFPPDSSNSTRYGNVVLVEFSVTTISSSRSFFSSFKLDSIQRNKSLYFNHSSSWERKVFSSMCGCRLTINCRLFIDFIFILAEESCDMLAETRFRLSLFRRSRLHMQTFARCSYLLATYSVYSIIAGGGIENCPTPSIIVV